MISVILWQKAITQLCDKMMNLMHMCYQIIFSVKEFEFKV